MKEVAAVIKQGYRVASGRAFDGHDQRFNADGGTIRLQIPKFRERGLDIDSYFGGTVDEAFVSGTLGCDIRPRRMTILRPEYHFKSVRWTDKFDRERPGFSEDFFLSEAAILFAGKSFKALIYIPSPETKVAHFHPPTTIEVIAQKIDGIKYGDRVTLLYSPEAIRIENP
ncbi:hypothetical protein [Rhodoblastus sp.]|uniref:hypothetical protein n=1 Tax=Rhodoblastus sp. TaxID=1962975 RepID=UPI003F985E49